MTQVAALAVAAVLLVAATAKLRSPAHVQTAVVSLRLPGVLRRLPLASVLATVELVLVAGLAFAWGDLRMWSTVLATLLLVAYLVVLARALRFDEDVSCACFGTLGEAKVSGRSVLRNVLLVGLGLAAVAGPHGEPTLSVSNPSSLATGAVLLAALGAVALAGGGNDSVTAPRPPERPSPLIGPAARVALADQREVVLTSLLGQRPALVLQLSWTCEPCMVLLNALPGWAGQARELSVLCSLPLLDPEHPPRLAAPLQPIFDVHGDLAAVMPDATPSALLIGADGFVASEPVVGLEDIQTLLDEISEKLGVSPPPRFAQEPP